MSTTAAVTATISRMMATNTPSWSSPFLSRTKDAEMAEGSRTTMPAKMMSEMPLPMPFSEICSPSHMISAVPAVSVIIVSSRKPQPGWGAIASPLGLRMPSSP